MYLLGSPGKVVLGPPSQAFPPMGGPDPGPWSPEGRGREPQVGMVAGGSGLGVRWGRGQKAALGVRSVLGRGLGVGVRGQRWG